MFAQPGVWRQPSLWDRCKDPELHQGAMEVEEEAAMVEGPRVPDEERVLMPCLWELEEIKGGCMLSPGVRQRMLMTW
ncbi:hypothetical protein LINPERHAP2_LOCUS9495 [Linum perenne]